MKERLAEILRAIGLWDRTPEPAVSHREGVRVYLAVDEERVCVGSLTRTEDGFEFAYSPEFVARKELPPISDLPDKERLYKSTVLWPFFLARLPPTDRPDVRDLLRERGIEPDAVLEVLAELGHHTISSPYDLELHSAA